MGENLQQRIVFQGSLALPATGLNFSGFNFFGWSKKLGLLGLMLTVLLSACKKDEGGSSSSMLNINGAGATFPYPIYSKWFHDYKTIDPSVEINYQSIGSGGGIRQLVDQTVHFGASDAFMKDDELANALEKTKKQIIHIPTVMGAVVLTYNLPGIEKPLSFNSEVLAKIFLGQITSWQDPAIKALNPGVEFPKDLPIVVVHRADGSGTTAIFTDYLSQISAEWQSKIGAGKAVNWPVGLGGKGNEGVTGLVQKTPGAIGYVEWIYAEKNNLPKALLQNKKGQFVAPHTESVVQAAAAVLKDIPADFRFSLVNVDATEAYPIVGFTYILVYQQGPKALQDKLKAFLNWALTEGQKSAESLGYAPLPQSLAEKVKARVETLLSE